MTASGTVTSRLHLLVLVWFCAISSAFAGEVDPLDHAVVPASYSDDEPRSKRCLFGVCLGRQSPASRPSRMRRSDLIPNGRSAELEYVDPLLNAMSGRRRGKKAAAWYARTLSSRQTPHDEGESQASDSW